MATVTVCTVGTLGAVGAEGVLTDVPLPPQLQIAASAAANTAAMNSERMLGSPMEGLPIIPSKRDTTHNFALNH